MKALALISGGLDSILAAKLILDQGIEIIGINFITPFYLSEVSKKAKILTEKLGIELKVIGLGEEFLEIVKSPHYGYGKNLNPCIDCRILTLKRAKEFMQEIGANFIITGEVLGQRPMSQNKRAIQIIEKETGLEGFIVRPLSGRLLPPTFPEKEGLIKREKFLDISGRSRKRQFELAKEYNISDYSSPAGGCLLTDPQFSIRVKDLLNSQMLHLHSINLIKNGRYFSISNSFKLVVGRNHEENQRLYKVAGEEDIIFEPQSKGPVAVGWGKIDDRAIEIVPKIVAYYCKDKNVKVNFTTTTGEKIHSMIRDKISEDELAKYRVEPEK